MKHDTVQLIEKNIGRAKEILAMHEALVRLETNRDFLKVVKQGYLEQEAIRLVHLKADPSMQSPASQLSIDRDINAIGGLLQFFRTVAHNASVAESSIASDEAMREEILAEDAA